jgi:predicted ATPase
MMFERLGHPAGGSGHEVSIVTIVAERLRLLDHSSRVVLEAAALLVRELDVSLLAAALQCSPLAIAASLERARACYLLVAAEGDPAPPRFSHALIRSAVRDGIEPARLPELHARLARALERRAGAALVRPHELAHYWWEAGVAAKSAYYDECSGDAALNVNAFADAARHYRRALAVCAAGGPEPRRLRAKLRRVVTSEERAV